MGHKFLVPLQRKSTEWLKLEAVIVEGEGLKLCKGSSAQEAFCSLCNVILLVHKKALQLSESIE